jgi:hypothetical protein
LSRDASCYPRAARRGLHEIEHIWSSPTPSSSLENRFPIDPFRERNLDRAWLSVNPFCRDWSFLVQGAPAVPCLLIHQSIHSAKETSSPRINKANGKVRGREHMPASWFPRLPSSREKGIAFVGLLFRCLCVTPSQILGGRAHHGCWCSIACQQTSCTSHGSSLFIFSKC